MNGVPCLAVGGGTLLIISAFGLVRSFIKDLQKQKLMFEPFVSPSRCHTTRAATRALHVVTHRSMQRCPSATALPAHVGASRRIPRNRPLPTPDCKTLLPTNICASV